MLRLARDADGIIENYRPGQLEKWGIGPDDIAKVNPDCVMVRVSLRPDRQLSRSLRVRRNWRGDRRVSLLRGVSERRARPAAGAHRCQHRRQHRRALRSDRHVVGFRCAQDGAATAQRDRRGALQICFQPAGRRATRVRQARHCAAAGRRGHPHRRTIRDLPHERRQLAVYRRQFRADLCPPRAY